MGCPAARAEVDKRGRRHIPMVEREVSFGRFRLNLTRRELRRGNNPLRLDRREPDWGRIDRRQGLVEGGVFAKGRNPRAE